MPDDAVSLDDWRASDLIGGDPDCWDGLDPGVRFCGNDVSAAIVFGFAEGASDVLERKFHT